MIDKTDHDPARAESARAANAEGSARQDLSAYPVFQQQLISARSRLDIEVLRLTRMQAFIANALRTQSDADFVTAIGEAIVDIFEVEFGICWLVDESGKLATPMGTLGIKTDSETLRRLGDRLLLARQSSPLHAEELTEETRANLADLLQIGQALCAPCLDAQGRMRAILLGGNTLASTPFYESIEREFDRSFDLFAQQVAALIENRTGRATIEYQMAEIQVAHHKLQIAVEVTQMIVWELDFATQRLTYDKAMLPILGLELDESLTSLPGWLARTHPDDIEQFMARLQASVQPDNPVFDCEYRLRDNHGQYRWIHSKGRFIQRDQVGMPILAVGISMNIMARKQFEADLKQHRAQLEELVQQRTAELSYAEARASHLLESSADGLYGIDNAGRVTFINPAGCRMLGYCAEQVIGRSAHDLFHHSKPDGSPYPAEECPAHTALHTGQEIRVDDETYWHADGHPIPVMYAIHPMMQAGRNVGAVISFVDMSVQHAAAQARERALIAAENLARTRSEFLANMSHEIRTPMNGVLGFAQIGHRHYRNSEKARNAFEKILASGQRLLAVVDDILDFSKIEAGKLSIEAVDMSLTEAIDHVLELVADRACAKGIEVCREIAADFPARCVSDPLRIGQILLNLLTNAVKFTEAGHVILAASREDDTLIFQVTDTGIGISAEQLEFIFNPFQQADGTTSRNFGGSGLGLTISKRIVELMKGSISVESTLGVGSHFVVRLPYCPSAETEKIALASTAADAHSQQRLAGYAILAAEDDLINQMVLEDILIDEGAHLVMVGNGREAIDRVVADGADAYDVVLMDIQMPDMNGYEAARRITELAPALPIVGQTANALEEDRDKCLSAGMVAHIAKPFEAEELITLVQQLAPIRRAR